MTVGELIKNKDYDYIEWRATLPAALSGDIFVGCSRSENGKLISLYGDSYHEDTEIISYEEWSHVEGGIKNGLTVVFEGKWV